MRSNLNNTFNLAGHTLCNFLPNFRYIYLQLCSARACLIGYN
ncbi:unnamed protein product [Staurois parvus]|uniref:Uncharacterized protein n=1 Tax=Staurois parvus TaxID=386267 RepID=A0ABN9EYN5_9NEOB|nr:unnamed protein product [Staurois parvus]